MVPVPAIAVGGAAVGPLVAGFVQQHPLLGLRHFLEQRLPEERAAEVVHAHSQTGVVVLLGEADRLLHAWPFRLQAGALIAVHHDEVDTHTFQSRGGVGAVLGHYLFGMDLTILSVFAILGLAGIVINDSIVLVTTIDSRRRTEDVFTATVNGACDRLRAVILTSSTTIGGLTPLLFERSLQAQFLIPMALTLVFGLLVTTFVVLLLVPALCVVQDDFSRFE